MTGNFVWQTEFYSFCKSFIPIKSKFLSSGHNNGAATGVSIEIERELGRGCMRLADLFFGPGEMQSEQVV